MVGIDAAYKMETILSQFAFGMKVAFDDVAHKGIRNIARNVAVAQDLGYAMRGLVLSRKPFSVLQ